MTSRIKESVFAYAGLFKAAFTELGKNDPLRMAGATAFFTTFALPPILIILIQVLGLVFDPKRISRLLFQRLADIIGRAPVRQVVDTQMAFRRMAQNWYITIGGFIFLLFVATTLFKVIKSSLNQVWKIKVVTKRSIWLGLRSRLQSIIVILIAGILFTAGLLAEGAQALLGNYIAESSPYIAAYFNSTLNYIVSIIVVTLWFAIVFCLLPDGRPQWKVAVAGAFLTSLLFTIGKVLLRWLLFTYTNINTVYGASGSIVLLLLFVFYSSLILYYGAAFTKVWGAYHGTPIKPLSHAMHYQLSEADD